MTNINSTYLEDLVPSIRYPLGEEARKVGKRIPQYRSENKYLLDLRHQEGGRIISRKQISPPHMETEGGKLLPLII